MTQKDKVAALATQENALPKNHIAVIGLFGARDDMHALVRMASGRIKRVKVGARLQMGRVVAIDAEGVLVAHGTETTRLSLLTGAPQD